MITKGLNELIFSELSSISSEELVERKNFKNPEDAIKLKVSIQSYALKQFESEINSLVKETLKENFSDLSLMEIEFDPTDPQEVAFTWPKEYIYSLFIEPKIRTHYLQKTVFEDEDFNFELNVYSRGQTITPIPDIYFDKITVERLAIVQKVYGIYEDFYGEIRRFQKKVREVLEVVLKNKSTKVFTFEETKLSFVLKNKMRGDFHIRLEAKGQSIKIPFKQKKGRDYKDVTLVMEAAKLSIEDISHHVRTAVVLLENRI